MKKHLLKLFSLLVFTALIFSSCNDKLFEEEPTGQDDEYLVSSVQVKIISQLQVASVLTYLKTLYPDAGPIADAAKTDVKVMKITYNTTFQGEDIVASGLVCLPLGTESYPLFSFQNGTNTLHNNAPSVNPEWELYQFLEVVASAGFVIAIPDYIGFGATEDKFHPYLDKESTVQCVLDMMRATRELCTSHNLNINLTNDLYIAGYSMGGWATLCTQKALETEYSDLFNLKASACSAGPYDLLYINNHILGLDTYPMPYFLGYMINSYSNLDILGVDISEIVNEPYATRIPTLFDGTKDGEEINTELTTSVSELLTEEYRDGFLTDSKYQPVRFAMLDNSVTAWDISTPTALLHGEDDVFVTPLVSENLYQDFINLGVSEGLIQMGLFPGIDHPEGIIPCGISSVNWFLEIKNGE